MGGCTSTPAVKKTSSHPKKLHKPKEDDELTQVDLNRINAERRQRQAEEDEITRQIYAEKAALKEITGRMIVKRDSCESLMDLLDSEELTDISLDEASFRAQKRARRKLLKQIQAGHKDDWMLYNNVEGIREPHMVHLALFMQKVMTTLTRVEAIKITQAQAHARSDGQLTKLSLSPAGAVIVAPITPPSSPVNGRSNGHSSEHRKKHGGRKTMQSAREGDERTSDPLAGASVSPFRTASQDSGDEQLRTMLDCPQDAATAAIIAQQNQLEEEFLQRKRPAEEGEDAAAGGRGSGDLEAGAPPSPPPSPFSSPRSYESPTSSASHSPRSPGHEASGTSTSTTSAAYGDMLSVGASLALRLGELISPEDELLLTNVQEGTGNFLDNVRSSKSHNRNTARTESTLSQLTPQAQEQHRNELLSLQICTIAPQTSYELTTDNLYDYDLPPGLVTLRVARTVLQLYRRGGRLTPKSVHKLLRLGYKSLSKRRNTTHVTVEPGEHLTVVGDLHGQLPDLLHILESSGLPSRTNKYIFNGDFVDRGSYGVEVMCTLLALHIALPEHVILNRGNHEDFAICTVYGFQRECCEKYGDVIFGLFVEIFQQLPLFAVINKAVIVLHGGLFHTKDTTLAELDSIERSAFSLQDLPEGGETLQPIPRAQQTEFLKQLVRDALWSDPADVRGIMSSVRGAGVNFGPDVTRAFLEANDLKFVVRSHECVRSGYDEPYSGRDKHLLCTIFSASDYGGAGNSAAYLRFHIPHPSAPHATPAAEASNAPHNPAPAKDDSFAPSATESATPTPAETPTGSTTEPAQPTTDASTAAVVGTTEYNEKTENCSEVKFVRDTNLTYTVHFYYVSPTFFEDTGDSTLWEHPTHSQSNADLTALNTAMNAGSGSAAGAQGSENYTYQKQGAGSDPAELAKTARGNSAKAASRKQSLDGSLGPGGLAAAVEGSNGSTAPPFLRRSKSLSAASASLLGISAADFFAEDESGPDALQVSDRDCVLIGSRMTLREYIVSRLDELRNEFERVDGKGAGVVTKFQWVNVMRQGMGLHLRWISIMQLLVLDRHFRSAHGKKMVDYREFLDSFEEEDGTAATGFGGAGRRGESAKEELGGELVDDEFTAVLKGAPAAAASAGGSAPGLQTSAVQVELPQSLHSPRDDVSTDGSEAASKLSPQRPQAEGSPSKASGVSRKRVSFMCEDSDIPATAIDSKHATGEQTSDGAVPANGKSISVSASGRPAPAAAVASSGSGAPGADAAEVPPLKTFGNHNISPELMEVLYIDYKEVEAAFAYFDRDCDGAITHSEFRAACRELNKYLPRGQKIRDVEALLALMDFEETGEILFNNFFELFRLSEMKLNVAIDEEDTLTSNLHHSENRDLVRRASAISMGGSFYASNTSKLAVHGVEINIDSEFTAKASDRVAASEAVGLNIDV